MSGYDSEVSQTQKFERAQRLARLGTWEWDIERQSFSCSEHLEDLLFGDPSHAPEPGPASILARVHPDDRADVVMRADEARRTHRALDFECRAVRPDNEICFAHVRGDTVCDEDGVAVQISGIVQDVTHARTRAPRPPAPRRS